MKSSLLVFLSLIIQTQILAQNFEIKVDLTGFKEGTKFTLEDVNDRLQIGTATLNKGKLTFKGTLDVTPKYMGLNAQQDGKFYWTTFLLSNESITIKGDTASFPFLLDIQSQGEEKYNQLLKKLTSALIHKRDSLTSNPNLAKWMSDTSTESKQAIRAIGKQLDAIDAITDSITLNFMNKYPNTYVSLSELYFFRKKIQPDSLVSKYNRFTTELKETIYGKKLTQFIKIGEVLKLKDMATNFSGIDTIGKTHSLVDYTGKYVLLDFTETFCGPCIVAVDELKEIQAKHKDSLQIISFYAEKQKDIFLKGIKRDNPSWLCIWDEKGTDSETVLKYGVSSYPSFFLLDKKGKIIAIFSGYGKGRVVEELRKKGIS